ncbi:MAG: hypothetical protein ACP5E3_17520, partial [Bacteroidales bacterium]
SGQTGQNTGMYHGKGEGKDDKKKELRKYLQRLDKGLNTLLEGYNIPLVVSSVDYVFSIFRDISSYENVYPENVSGNVDEENIADVHENACEVLIPYFNKVRNRKKEAYQEADKKASSDLEKIMAASDTGQVESLFVKKNVRVWGVYDRKNMKTTLHKERKDFEHCILDFAARNTIQHGGRVYNENAESMPEPGTKVNAILRYL